MTAPLGTQIERLLRDAPAGLTAAEVYDRLRADGHWNPRYVSRALKDMATGQGGRPRTLDRKLERNWHYRYRIRGGA